MNDGQNDFEKKRDWSLLLLMKISEGRYVRWLLPRLKLFTLTGYVNEMNDEKWKTLLRLLRLVKISDGINVMSFPEISQRQKNDCVVKWRKINRTNLSKEGVLWRNQKKCWRGDLMPEKCRRKWESEKKGVEEYGDSWERKRGKDQWNWGHWN